MRIGFGSDEDAPVVTALRDHLVGDGHDVRILALGVPWPEVGRAVGDEVAAGGVDLGVVWCWTGTGVCMAANKVPGVRAALCADGPTADGARRWNDANVLALSIRSTTPAVAAEIADAFLAGVVDPGEAHLIDGLG